jgi:ornithine carbamoyltransferase
MIFDKASTRTRVAFEAGMIQLGGQAIFLPTSSSQLGRGEPIADTARVLSRMVDLIMVRTSDQQHLETFAQYSQVPVINGLSDQFHPCQLLADMQTYRQHRGSISGKTVAWIGDGNNMCHSYINAAKQFNFKLQIACPPGHEPKARICSLSAEQLVIQQDPKQAVKGADLVVTDVWTSMGQEQQQQQRLRVFADYQVTPALMDLANPEALFMHCLPAHRGEEVSDSMLEDPRSVVWDEAENRLHSQKALLEKLAGF